LLQFILDICYYLNRLNIVFDTLLKLVVLTKKKLNNSWDIFNNINIFYNRANIVVEVNIKTNIVNRLIKQTIKERKNIAI